MAEVATRRLVRAVTPEDLPAVLRMATRFLESEYVGRIAEPACIEALAAKVTGSDDACGFIAEQDGEPVGMMAVVTYQNMLTGRLAATELCWWMDPDARGGRLALQMLAQAERWAKARGARTFQMIAPSDHVAQFYEKLGFRRVEIHYERTL